MNREATPAGPPPPSPRRCPPSPWQRADWSTQTAGNVAAGTKSTTHQLSAQDDPDLIPENIREGVSVFGVRGTMQAGTGGVTSETVAVIVTLTEAEYNALSAKDPSTLYLIKE